MTAQPPHTACPGCGFSASASPNPANALPLATRLNNQFIIGRELGTGGFGITYLAYDIKLRRAVAIKEYFPREQCGREENRVSIAVLRSTSPESYQYGLNKFLEEAQTLARFQDVPGIVNVGSFFEANKTGYIVMDYLQGITLEEYLKRRGDKIPFDEALKILMPILDALKEVHAANLLHRDISPDNIFITKQKQVKLIDFGAARMAARDHSQNFSIILKEGYAPEEQYRSKGKQGPWTDLYAIGAMFYRCITGQLPPQALDRALDDAPLIPPSKMGVAIRPEHEAALLKALEVKASNRYPNVREFQDELLLKTKKSQPQVIPVKFQSKEIPDSSNPKGVPGQIPITPKCKNGPRIDYVRGFLPAIIFAFLFLIGVISNNLGRESSESIQNSPKPAVAQSADQQACDSISRSYNNGSSTGDILAAWTQYLDKYPQGRCRETATIFIRTRQTNHDCQLAKQQDDIEGWQQYLENYPHGDCATLGRDQLEKLQKEKQLCSSAQELDTIAAWENILRTHRNGVCADQARDRLAEFENQCNTAKDANTLEGWRAYLAKHPEGQCSKIGLEIIRDLTSVPANRMIKIPEGLYWTGCALHDLNCEDDEIRVVVYLPSFKIDKREVTVREYRECVDRNICPTPSTGEFYNWDRKGFEDHPINGVTWLNASSYCAWRGKRLPTEDEWEKAARKTNDNIFPWGHAEPSCEHAVFNVRTGACSGNGTSRVCSRPSGNSPFGLCDMAGNVWEWTSSIFEAQRSNLILKGGAWNSHDSKLLRSSRKDYDEILLVDPATGFRCAR